MLADRLDGEIPEPQFFVLQYNTIIKFMLRLISDSKQLQRCCEITLQNALMSSSVSGLTAETHSTSTH